MKPRRTSQKKTTGTRQPVGKEQLIERIDTRRIYKDERRRLNRIRRSKRRLKKSERRFLLRLYRDLRNRLTGKERRELETRQHEIFNRLNGTQHEFLLRTMESGGRRNEKAPSAN